MSNLEFQDNVKRVTAEGFLHRFLMLATRRDAAVKHSGDDLGMPSQDILEHIQQINADIEQLTQSFGKLLC